MVVLLHSISKSNCAICLKIKKIIIFKQMKNKKKSAKAGNAERASKNEQLSERLRTFYAEEGIVMAHTADKSKVIAVFPNHGLTFTYDVEGKEMQVNGACIDAERPIKLPVLHGDVEDYNLLTMAVLTMYEEFPEVLFAYTLMYMGSLAGKEFGIYQLTA